MKIVSNILKIFGIILVIFVFFYLFFIIPNDDRVQKLQLNGTKTELREVLAYDFIDNLPHASISCPSVAKSGKILEKYPYRQTSSYIHSHPLNLHVSLGWFPLKTDHLNSIFAPAPSTFEFPFKTPQKPVLKFNYGIISSIEKKMCAPVSFRVELIDEKKNVHILFEKTVASLKPYTWRYYDSFYKNFYKYFSPDLEDREGKWDFADIDISSYAEQNVKIRFIAECAKNADGTALSFWGNPRIYTRVNGKIPPNIILVVIDSFRKDELNPKSTPNLWDLAEKGANFQNALSNGNMTKLSVYSFLTSRYPFEIPEAATHYELSAKDKDNFYKRKIASLPSVLRKCGYSTCEIGSVSLFSDGHGLSADLGFDESINLEHSGYSPPHVTGAGIDWLKKHGSEKFFLMLYYDGPHGPYRPPIRYLLKSIRTRGLLGGIRMALYRGEIIYHDQYIGYLKEYLKSSWLIENTLIVFTSDHGVAFRSAIYDWPTKHGAWRKKKVQFHSHGVSVTPEDIGVPLIFYMPGKISARHLENHVQLLDLAPTLVDIANAKIPAEFKGQSLLPAMEGKPFEEIVTFHHGWLNYGVYLRDKYLYIKNTAPRDKFPVEALIPEELYDLKDDAQCRNNLAVRDSPVLTRMRNIMKGFLPRNEVNRIILYASPGKKAELSIFVDGTIKEVKTNEKVKPIGNSSLQVNLAPGQALDFTTIPNDASFNIKAFVDGKLLNTKHYLCGRYALPLLGSGLVETKDRGFFEGIPKKFEQNDKPVLLLGIEQEAKPSAENLEKSPKQLKSMLEEWGYIN